MSIVHDVLADTADFQSGNSRSYLVLKYLYCMAFYICGNQKMVGFLMQVLCSYCIEANKNSFVTMAVLGLSCTGLFCCDSDKKNDLTSIECIIKDQTQFLDSW